MASKLYHLLNGIHGGIEKCKENAKLAGFPVNEHTTLYTLADMFKEINNLESMRTRNTRPWKRPDNWLDAENILRNAEDKDGLQPRFIIVYYEGTSVKIPKYIPDANLSNSANKNLGTYGTTAALTSDGAWYTNITSEITHTWGEPVNGFHYIIGYSDDPVLNRFNMKPIEPTVCEVVFGNCQVNQAIFDNNLVSIKCLGDLIDPEMSILSVGAAPYGTRLQNLDLSGIKKLMFMASSALPTTTISILKETLNLTNVVLLDVEEMIFYPQYNSTHIAFSIPYLYVPKLKKITAIGGNALTFGSGSPSNPRTYLFLDAPELETISDINMFLSGVYAPKLVSVTGSLSCGFNLYGNGGSFYLPLLQKIGTGTAAKITLNINSVDNLTLPSLEMCDAIDRDYYTTAYGNIYLPKLHTLYRFDTAVQVTNTRPYGYGNQSGYSTKGGYIDIPSLKTITYLFNDSSNGGALATINIPSIETITFGLNYCTDTTVIFPETLTSLPANCFKNCFGAYEIILPNNFAFSGLDLTNSTLLTKTNLRDIVSKLADVRSDTDNVYEITFGATNIAKLTEEEWQVARDKGWVVQ